MSLLDPIDLHGRAAAGAVHVASGIQPAHLDGPMLCTELAVSEATGGTFKDLPGIPERSRGWASLTPTERDVVSAAADGLTKPQIATKLFMSRDIVKTHLKHVYAKLGVANRTELASAALLEGDRSWTHP